MSFTSKLKAAWTLFRVGWKCPQFLIRVGETYVGCVDAQRVADEIVRACEERREAERERDALQSVLEYIVGWGSIETKTGMGPFCRFCLQTGEPVIHDEECPWPRLTAWKSRMRFYGTHSS